MIAGGRRVLEKLAEASNPCELNAPPVCQIRLRARTMAWARLLTPSLPKIIET